MSGASICLRCELRGLIAPRRQTQSPWSTQRRFASNVRQQKRPSRMVLADNVGRAEERKKKQDVAGPFAGMNQTTAPLRLRQQQEVKTKPEKYVPSNKDDRPLFHALKMQTALAPLSYNARNSLKDQLDKIESFDELGLRPDVLDAIKTQALPGLETLTPTPAQKIAIPALIKQKSPVENKKKAAAQNEYEKYLLAAETGSGKTLAYLLPIVHQIKNQEEVEKQEEVVRKAVQDKRNKEHIFDVEAPPLADAIDPNAATGRPRALILLPSTELVEQVGRVVKIISHKVKYRSAPISASNTPTVIRSRLFNPNGVDIIISTPHLISSIAEKEPNILSRVNHIVVDEADSLFDRSFRDITMGIVDRAAPSLKQLILCSATIPRNLDAYIDKRFPMMKRLVTPKIHSIPRRVQLGVIDIDKEPYRGNRMVACADAIWKLGRSEHDEFGKDNTVKHIMVFCNERGQADELAAYLQTKGIDAAALTRDTSERGKADILSSFTSATKVMGTSKEDTPSHEPASKAYIPFEEAHAQSQESVKPAPKKLQDTKVLVTTDLCSRGIDTLAVRHAILYDVPHTTIDFVHRLGRLGRMNRRGRGIVLVGKKDRKDVVREVRDAMFRGQALI